MTAPQANDSTHSTLEVVRFQAGNCFCAIAASQVGAMSLASEACDATPIEEIFGLKSVATGLVRKKLELKPVSTEAGLHPDSIDVLITPPVDLLHLAVADIHPLPPLLAARKSLRWLRALATPKALASLAGQAPPHEQEGSSLVLLFDVPENICQ